MSSWWNSIETLETFNTWLRVLTVVFGVLTAIATALTIVGGNRISALKSAESKALRAELEEARSSADVARQQIKEVAERHAPRTFTVEQRARFVSALRNGPRGPVVVDCVMGDGEARAFAMEIHALLLEAGFNVGPLTRTLYSGNPTGIVVAINNKLKSSPPHAELILDVLTSIGISVRGEMSKEIPPDGVRVVVGHKL